MCNVLESQLTTARAERTEILEEIEHIKHRAEAKFSHEDLIFHLDALLKKYQKGKK